jgi:predicted RNA-binding protein with PIN domain
MIKQLPLQLMADALEAGRAALSSLAKTDDVPAKLRRVASYQGGHLPKPLALSLLKALHEEDWLREKAAEMLEEGAGPSVEAAELFLKRPPDWQFTLGRLAGRIEDSDTSGALEKLGRDLEEAEKREGEARKRLDQAVEELGKSKRLQRAEVDELRAKLRALKRSDQAHDRAFDAKVAALEEANAAAEAAAARLDDLVEKLRARLAKAEKERARLERRLQTMPTSSGFLGVDPVGLARHLDSIALASRRAVEEVMDQAVEAAGQREDFRLPPGAMPDGSNSVEWLLRQPRPFRLLVDGYNVTFKLGIPEPTSGSARDALNEHISRFKLLAKTPVQAVVVYDSNIAPGIEEVDGPGGVSVRFTDADTTADEEIRQLAGVTAGPLVVVSSDREVREGSEERGAIGLWSEAFVAWVRGR